MGEECPSEGWIKRSKQFSDRRFRYDGKRLIWSFKEKGEKKYAIYTIGKFLKEFKQGTYFILVRQHALTIKDGIVYGNSSDATSLKVRIERAYKVENV